VANPANPGSRVAATVALKGGLLATPDALTKLAGPTIAYAPATTTRRTVWLSQGFQRGHPACTAIIRALAGRKWRLVETDVAFRAAHRARGPRSVIGIVTEDEKRVFLALLFCSNAHAHSTSHFCFVITSQRYVTCEEHARDQRDTCMLLQT